MICNRWETAQFASYADSENVRFRLIVLQDVPFSDVFRRKHRNERRWARRLLHVRTTLGFLPFDQAHHTCDFKSKFTCGFNRLDRGTASCTYIVDDHHARAFFRETFDASSGTVLLFSLPHQKSVQLAAHNRNGHHNWIGSHGQTADRRRIPTTLLDLFPKYLASQP